MKSIKNIGVIQKNGLYINKGGIENYINKELIGKYDGINAIMSAGYHTNFPERNIIKIAMMLKPKGIAVVTLNLKKMFDLSDAKRKSYITGLRNVFRRLKLDNLYNIDLINKRIIIITRN